MSDINYGWIKLHRTIKEHWLFNTKEPKTKFEAWIDLLLTVNSTTKKVQIGHHVVTCKPGQLIRSYAAWADRWNWSRTTVIRFFRQLECEKMIKCVSLHGKATQVTIVKWDTYQVERTSSGHQVDTKWTPSGLHVDTTKEYKELKEREEREEGEEVVDGAPTNNGHSDVLKKIFHPEERESKKLKAAIQVWKMWKTICNERGRACSEYPPAADRDICKEVIEITNFNLDEIEKKLKVYVDYKSSAGKPYGFRWFASQYNEISIGQANQASEKYSWLKKDGGSSG